MENTTHLFLAVRFNCNKCHDHPFERWTQDQYYQMAAFFAQVGLKADPASGGRKIGGTRVEAAKPLFEDRRRQAGRRGRARADRRRSPRRSSRSTATSEAAENATAARAAGRVDHLDGQPVLRQELRQPPLGLPASASASSSRSTTSAPATRRPTPSCSTT